MRTRGFLLVLVLVVAFSGVANARSAQDLFDDSLGILFSSGDVMSDYSDGNMSSRAFLQYLDEVGAELQEVLVEVSLLELTAGFTAEDRADLIYFVSGLKMTFNLMVEALLGGGGEMFSAARVTLGETYRMIDEDLGQYTGN